MSQLFIKRIELVNHIKCDNIFTTTMFYVKKTTTFSEFARVKCYFDIFKKLTFKYECYIVCIRATETKSNLLKTLNTFASSVSIPDDNETSIVDVRTADINIQVNINNILNI